MTASENNTRQVNKGPARDPVLAWLLVFFPFYSFSLVFEQTGFSDTTDPNQDDRTHPVFSVLFITHIGMMLPCLCQSIVSFRSSRSTQGNPQMNKKRRGCCSCCSCCKLEEISPSQLLLDPNRHPRHASTWTR
ncbi:hypothetical protein M432DRAFT_136319 [Thermoascus aurantiacus ATCC 26904]